MVFFLFKNQVIAKARVPIIKFVEKKSGVSFDIRFGYSVSIFHIRFHSSTVGCFMRNES